MAVGEEGLIGVPEAGAGKVASEAEAEAGKVALAAEAAFRAEAAPEAVVVLGGQAGDEEEDDQATAEELWLQAASCLHARHRLDHHVRG